MATLLVIPTPPRLSGLDTAGQVSAIATFMENLTRVLVAMGGVYTALAEIEQIALGVSDPPTQVEVLTIRNKINEVIVAAGQISLEAGDS